MALGAGGRAGGAGGGGDARAFGGDRGLRCTERPFDNYCSRRPVDPGRDRRRSCPDPHDFLTAIAHLTPAGAIRNGLQRAADLPPDTPAWKAADILGNGHRILASDTAPFAIWSAAHHLDSLTDALWTTAEGLGDVDTTCAITGGIVGARTGLRGVSERWLELMEALPEWVE